jgi:ATP-dependent RNA helicase DDX3X
MACAQTGSGKAVAFCSPIIVGIMKNMPWGCPHGGHTAFPLALILSPTWELFCQVCCPPSAHLFAFVLVLLNM